MVPSLLSALCVHKLSAGFAIEQERKHVLPFIFLLRKNASKKKKEKKKPQIKELQDRLL